MIESHKEGQIMLMKRTITRFPALLGIFFSLIFFSGGYCMANGVEYENFSDCDLIRFHIRAQSNARIDQEAKMAVRQDVLSYIAEKTKDCNKKEDVRSRILSYRSELEKIIEKRLKSYGMQPVISIYFTKEFFPMRKYGQTIVPAGIYEALRIDLGRARGKNWWCMLYPGLCLIDSEHVLENPEDKEKLEQLFEGENVKTEYRSFFLKLWKNITGD